MSPQQLAYRAAHFPPWHERIGDGGPVGWMTAAAYLLVALLCFGAARRAPAAVAERPLWLAAGAVLLVLGINKELDLQIALIEFWREIALEHGWYGARRMVQWVAFGVGIVGGVVTALWLLSLVRRQGVALKIAFAGMSLIGAYVVLRAAKFQHVLWDVPGYQGPGWPPVLELVGIAVVAGAAWHGARRR